MSNPASVLDLFSAADFKAWRGFLATHAALTQHLSEAMESSANLSLGEYEVLLKLASSDDGKLPMATLNELTLLTLSASGLSRLVDRLRRRGLLTREACLEGDRRSAVIAITAEGRELWRIAADGHQQRVKDWFLSRLSQEQIELLGDIWDQVLAED